MLTQMKSSPLDKKYIQGVWEWITANIPTDILLYLKASEDSSDRYMAGSFP